MFVRLKDRASARALLSAAPGFAAGAALGVALGGVFLAAGMGHDIAVAQRAAKLAQQVGGDVSQSALQALADKDAGALAVALRQNPGLMGDQEADDRRETQFAQALGRKAQKGLTLRASVRPDSPAAPYHGALDQTRDLDCLAQAVYYEARGETAAGQAAVAQVVLNRVRHPAFPKSVCGVVYQGAQSGRSCQFSFACNGAMRGNRETGAWRQAQKIAARALSGYVMPEVGSATHFHVTSVHPGWGPQLLRVAQVGVHVFYKFSGRAAPRAVTQPETPKPIFASLTITPIDPQAAVTTAANTVVEAVTRIDTPAVQAAPLAPQAAPSAATPKPAEAPTAPAPVTVKAVSAS